MQGKTILNKTSEDKYSEVDFDWRNSRDKRCTSIKSQLKKAQRKFRKGNKVKFEDYD